jgi:phosphoenolpyruvate-protein kinase (PTS system EI component)
MVETPSAMMMLNQLKNADFFSIGTNDLTQFLFAIDRENYRLEAYREFSIPLIIYCLQNIVSQCNTFQKEVIVCGEIASNPEAVPLLIGVGIRALSVQAPMLHEIRKIIETRTIDQMVSETNNYLSVFRDKQKK